MNKAKTEMKTEIKGFIVIVNEDGIEEKRPFTGYLPIELAEELEKAGVPQHKPGDPA